MKQFFEFVLKSQLKKCAGHKVNVGMKRSSESVLDSQKEIFLNGIWRMLRAATKDLSKGTEAVLEE